MQELNLEEDNSLGMKIEKRKLFNLRLNVIRVGGLALSGGIPSLFNEGIFWESNLNIILNDEAFMSVEIDFNYNIMMTPLNVYRIIFY